MVDCNASIGINTQRACLPLKWGVGGWKRNDLCVVKCVLFQANKNKEMWIHLYFIHQGYLSVMKPFHNAPCPKKTHVHCWPKSA